MRPDTRTCDAIDLFARLASRGRHDIPAASLRTQFGANVDFLLWQGALIAGRPLTNIVCPGCDEDHPVAIEFDSTIGRSSCFCPSAGRVLVEDCRLETFRVQTNWLARRAASVLEIAPSPPSRELMTDRVWWLGDRNVGSTKVSFALSLGIRGEAATDELTTGLKKRQPADLGILLTSQCMIPDAIGSASGYHPVDLGEVLRLDAQGIALDHARLGRWVRALLNQGKKSMAAHVGRPSVRERVLFIFGERRIRQLHYKSKSSEAKAIMEVWQSHFPDLKIPSLSAVRGHLP
jgi:hypothetical protein